jgi:ATP-dependent RNA helicase HelY
LSCDRGDFTAYARMRRELSRLEREAARGRAAAQRTAVVESLASLRRGDVVLVPAGRRPGTAVVLEPAADPVSRPVIMLNENRQVRRVLAADCPVPVTAIERIAIPSRFNPRSPQQRKDLAASMRNKLAGVDVRARRSDRARANGPEAGRAAIADLRRRLRQHPCHTCPDAPEHARQAEEYVRLEGEADALDRRVAGRAHVVARTFGQVCAVLGELGYLSDDDTVTADGQMLAGLYSERDLLTAECMRRGIWADLGPADLAACVSALTFEARGPDDGAAGPQPRGVAGSVLAEMTRIWTDLDRVERAHGLEAGRQPDSGFARTAQTWVTGGSLADVLAGDITAGDFVRAVKQVIDLLDQIREAAGARSKLAQTAAQAVTALRRGVVAYSSVT